MRRLERLGGREFAPGTTYLNTASGGLLPARSIAAVADALEESRSYGTMGRGYFPPAHAARESFARLVGAPARRVAVGGSVSVHVALVAQTLPTGAEVLVPEGDFSSLVNPFAARGDLKLRTAPLEKLAETVRPGTALVALSAVQSADGRPADLAAIRSAAHERGARTLVDITQAAGWMPLRAADFDYAVCGAFKWLLSPRGASFMVVPEEGEGPGPRPLHAGWVAGEVPGDSSYGVVARLAPGARKFDEPHAGLSYAAAERSLALLEEIGIETIHAHNLALADRCRAGLVELGHRPLQEPTSAIVAVPGLGGEADRLSAAGLLVSERAGNLRVCFHLYNSSDDVDRLLEALKQRTETGTEQGSETGDRAEH